jgi:hypothetical protein
MRTIAASGVGSYRINDVEVTWETYDKRLQDIGVLTKARNFLVFQASPPFRCFLFIQEFLMIKQKPIGRVTLSQLRPNLQKSSLL